MTHSTEISKDGNPGGWKAPSRRGVPTKARPNGAVTADSSSPGLEFFGLAQNLLCLPSLHFLLFGMRMPIIHLFLYYILEAQKHVGFHMFIVGQ